MKFPIIFLCPPMPIYFEGVGLRKTAVEPMTMTANLSGLPSPPGVVDGNLSFLVRLPPTLVCRQMPLQWLVDACQGLGDDGYGNAIVIDLPPEPCNVDIEKAQFVARSFTWTGTLTLSDGRVGKIVVVQPDCPIRLFPLPLLAAQVTAVGTVEFPDPIPGYQENES